VLNAVLFVSKERFHAFREKLEQYQVNVTVLDFSKGEWIDFDYSGIDIIIYYPSFQYSSNFPLALFHVHDNLQHIQSLYPDIEFYPDLEIIRYYNDKYRQFLFLKSTGLPIPQTIPLLSNESVQFVHERLGYPLILKNRFGAGGGYVYKVEDKKELENYFHLSNFNLFRFAALRFFYRILRRRIFYYHFIKARKMLYPFLSPPLLAQEFIEHNRDLKTVVGNYKVVEAHWRKEADKGMWKMNIDGGGIGEWSKVPKEAIDLSENLARRLQTSWVNVDLMEKDGQFLVSEFSPVWHHYAYKEKPNFVYKADYNIDMPLEISLDLERLIIESLIQEAKPDEF
jgi:hypothetical protein